MPQGIITSIDQGFATIDFVEKSLRGPALARLLEIGGPETIKVHTRSGPRRLYEVPEDNARLAGLIDEPADADAELHHAVVIDTPQGGISVELPQEEQVLTPAQTEIVADTEPEVVDPEPTVVDPEPEVVEPEPTVVDPEPTDVTTPQPVTAEYLDTLDFDELRAFAKARDIDLDGARSKVAIRAKIDEALNG